MQTWIVIASGPSTTVEDIERAHVLRSTGEVAGVVVTNAMFRAVPWADFLYANDPAFWKVYLDDVICRFQGERLAPFPPRPMRDRVTVEPRGLVALSGIGAIEVAVRRKADRIILLGFDGQPGPSGRLHYHEDHPAPLKNCYHISDWPAKYAKAAAQFKIPIINASRNTAIIAWPRATLEQIWPL